MATLRTPQLAHFLIVAACSAADPTPSDVQGVYALDPSVAYCSGSNCTHEEMLGADVAFGSAFVAHDTGSSPNGPPQGWVVERLEFDGGSQQLSTTTTQQSVLPSQLAVAGQIIDVVGNGTIVEVNVNGGGPAGAANPTTQNPVGLVVDPTTPRVAYFGTAPMQQGKCTQNGPCITPDPNQSSWNAPAVSGTGAIVRVPLDGSATKSLTTTLLITYSRHLFAADANNVYWIGGSEPGQVMAATKADLTQLPNVADVGGGKAASGLAVSASGSTLAWSAMGDLFGSPQSPSCEVWVRGVSNPVFTSNQLFCLGLAVDDTYAWFAVVELKQGQQFNDADGGTSTFDYVAGTAIGRVALAGPANQQPALVPTVSTQYYGPRRVLLDPSTPDYVYAIDPALVLRIKKSSFGP